MTLEAIRYNNGKLEILDQLLLPLESKYIPINNTEDGWRAIKQMQVRGAPAIGVVGSLSLAVELSGKTFHDATEMQKYVAERLSYLVSARPTAVNMADFEQKLNTQLKSWIADGLPTEELKARLLAMMESFLDEDVKTCKAIGKHGAEHIIKNLQGKSARVLTHCNTGSLATAGYGTALGVVRSLHAEGRLAECFCTETRPYNQGARLTAYELVHDKLPSTLICDSMASMLMKTKDIAAVIVGADRVVANGDTANKIGTYQLAIAAKHHNVPFYVAAPSTSIDLTLRTGDKIVIEERPREEMTSIKGMQIAAPGIGVWNPAFDVTPAELITGGIVTEFGVFTPAELESQLLKHLSK